MTAHYRIRQLVAIILLAMVLIPALHLFGSGSIPGFGSTLGQTLDGTLIKSWDEIVSTNETAIIVVYWDSHCSLCMQLLGELARQVIDGDLAYSDIAVVAISPSVAQDTPESVAILVEQYQIPFPILIKGTLPKGIPSTPYTEVYIRTEQDWTQIKSLRWLGYWEGMTFEIINSILVYQQGD